MFLADGVQPVGIVSNHMGYCDILIHMANSFPSFVARGATKDLIMIGLIR
jgi:lysophosphatidylcholine acyltransferase / lyso-PAF acetyltransferase